MTAVVSGFLGTSLGVTLGGFLAGSTIIDLRSRIAYLEDLMSQRHGSNDEGTGDDAYRVSQ